MSGRHGLRAFHLGEAVGEDVAVRSSDPTGQGVWFSEGASEVATSSVASWPGPAAALNGAAGDFGSLLGRVHEEGSRSSWLRVGLVRVFGLGSGEFGQCSNLCSISCSAQTSVGVAAGSIRSASRVYVLAIWLSGHRGASAFPGRLRSSGVSGVRAAVATRYATNVSREREIRVST